MNDKELLYDHYKDTITNIKSDEAKRNKIFIALIVHLLVLFLISINSMSIYNMIEEFLLENFKIQLYFSINSIQLIMMFSMLYCSIRYYQINIGIDRMYNYLHKVEKEISKKINTCISREGDSYLKNYPKTLNFIYFSYKYIFPILFMTSVIIRLFVNNTWDNWKVKIFEIFITIAILILNILYMYDTAKENK